MSMEEKTKEENDERKNRQEFQLLRCHCCNLKNNGSGFSLRSFSSGNSSYFFLFEPYITRGLEGTEAEEQMKREREREENEEREGKTETK